MLTENTHLNIRASLSAPLESIEPRAPPFDPPFSSSGQAFVCHVHIKTPGNALYVCTSGILSSVFCGSRLVDTAATCHGVSQV